MTLYKRVFPYALVASVVLPACSGMKTFTTKGVVKEISNENYYCDINNDNLVDLKLRISDFNSEKRMIFMDYIQTGDTLYLRLPKWVLDEGKIIISDIDSVNNHTYKDLLRLYKVNKIRSEIGQQNSR